VGTVSYYWEHKPLYWLEMGIAIYETKYWSGGYGTKALSLWIDHLFNTLPLVRVGFATWSGNPRMIRVGERLGMQMEGRLRNAVTTTACTRFHSYGTSTRGMGED
jgi:RimJ/RimL family protein N-acetyltransferase